LSHEYNVSENIVEAFEIAEVSLDMLNFKEIYSRIATSMPPRNSSFENLSLEDRIGCEVVCAAICHQINWDFLRDAVYKMTLDDSAWINPASIAKITSAKVTELLASYNKPKRIRARERCSLLRSVGRSLLEMDYGYYDIFFAPNFSIKKSENMIGTLNSSKAFSEDPEGKKTQLLLQNLSDYEEFNALRQYCKPAIDYHIIRGFLRRGLVKPVNQKAFDFIFNPNIQRKEQTVAALRKICSDVFDTIQWLTACDITTINTIEWWIGRSVCLKDCPDCNLKTDSAKWLKSNFDRCPFYDSCYAVQSSDKRFIDIVEPTYQGSSY